MDVAEYLISLKDGMSGPASAADGALRKLETTLRKDESALASMEAKLVSQGSALDGLGSKLQAAEDAWRTMVMESDKSKEAEAAIKAQGRAVMTLQKQVDSATAAYAKMQEKTGAKRGDVAALKEAVPEYKKLSDASKQAGGATDSLKDNMPQLEGNLGKVQQALMKLGPAGVVVAAVFAAVVIAATLVIGTLYKLASAAIAVSQEKDALANTFKALSTGAESGLELVDSLSEVAAALPFAEGKVLAWGKSLMSAGIEGKALEGRVIGIASAAALMGDEGGAAAENLFKQLAAGGDAADSLIKTVQSGGKKAAVALAAMGLQSKDLAAALGVTPEKLTTMKLTADQLGDALQKALVQKGAKSLEAMGLTWASITGKLDDAWGDLFEDMGSAVQPFMAEVKSLFAEFSAGGTAQGLTKSLLVSFLTTLFSVATRVTHAIHLGFLKVEIAMLKVYIFLAPLINAFRAMMGSTTFLDGLAIVLKVIGVALLLIGGPLFAITAAFFAFGTAVMAVVGVVISALSWCVGDAARAGSAIITGLGQGLMSGFSIIGEIMSSLGRTALNAFKSVLGIHSPSAVMRMQGRFTAEGAALGIDDGAADVEASAGAMAQGAASAGGSRTVTAKGASGNTYSIVQNFYGSAKSMAEEAEMAVRRVLEMDANAEPMPEGA